MAAEKNFENKVKGFLRNAGCWQLKTWSNGVQRSGIPDLLVCCNSKFVGVELKAPNGKPTELQLHNLKKIEESNGYGILLYPSDFKMFKLLIKSFLENQTDSAEYYHSYFQSILRDWIEKLKKE